MYHETVDDLTRKYAATYVLYNGVIAFIHSFKYEDSQMSIQYETRAATKAARDQFHDEPFEESLLQLMAIDSKFTNVGSFEKDLFVVASFRYPRRQWKRGLCEENTIFVNPMTALYIMAGQMADNPRLGFHVLQGFTTPIYPKTVQEAIQLLSKHSCVALSPDFAICLSSYSDKNYLLMGIHSFIGEVGENGIVVHHEPAWQEVKDFVRRTNQSIPIHLEAV